MRILLIPDLLTLSSNGPTLLPFKLLASVYNSSIFCIAIWYHSSIFCIVIWYPLHEIKFIWYPLHEMFPMAVLMGCYFYSQSVWMCSLATAVQGSTELSFATACCRDSINLPFLNSNWPSPHLLGLFFISLLYQIILKTVVLMYWSVKNQILWLPHGISKMDFIASVYRSVSSCCPAAATFLLWNLSIYIEVIKKLLSPPMCC